MCVTHADWDIDISEQLKDKFDFIVKFVKTLTTVKVSRCYFYDILPRDYIVTYKLHGFSDASELELWWVLSLFEMCDKKQFHFNFASCFKVKGGPI